jgi:HTH-type transcriptional regulator / antitoxin HipB
LKQKSKSMQTTSFNEVLDIHIGKRGTKKREKFEQELRIELLGDAMHKKS